MSNFTSTPQVQDPYSRMIGVAFDERKIIGVPTGFLSWFGRPGFGKTLYSETATVVDIDIMRGSQKTAALVPRGNITKPIGGTKKTLEGSRYTSFSRRFPLSLEEGVVTADQLEFRQMGELAHLPKDIMTRLRTLLLDEHEEQVRRTVRLFERLAAQSIVTGKQDAILGGGPDNQYNFMRKASHTFASVGTYGSWGTAGSNVLGCISAGCDLIRKDGNVTPDFALASRESLDGLMKNTEFATYAESRRINLTQWGADTPMPAKFQRFVDAGMIFRGRLDTKDGYTLYVFTYLDEYWDDETETLKPYLPADTFLIGSSMALCDRYFGPAVYIPKSPAEVQEMQFYLGINPAAGMMPQNIRGANDVISPNMFYFDAYKNSRKSFMVESQSAPIFVPTMTDAWVTIDTK